ncbi:MAG: hypothetical protein IJ333_05965 [Clostridia bacterium]|nr:hypothetical protein [Clostridia bacterium]
MIEIKKVTDSTVAEKICKEHGIQLETNDFVIATVEKENVLHCAVFSYENDIGRIKAISGFGGDLNLLDGLCRAILNIMDINGVKEVYLPDKYSDLAKYVGFQEDANGYSLKLEGFFKCGCCNHERK